MITRLLTRFVLIMGLPLFLLEAQALDAQPIFSLDISSNLADAGAKVGKWTYAERAGWDKFYMPASFAVNKQLGLVIVLDSIRNRLCKYSLSGTYMAEAKLSFTYHPIDFAWFAAGKKMFIVFQDSPKIGNINSFDLTKTNPISGSYPNTKDLPAAIGAQKVQNIWPSQVSGTSEYLFALNIVKGPVSRAAFTSGGYLPTKLADINPDLVSELIGSAAAQSLIGISADGREVIIQNMKTGTVESRFTLPAELITQAQDPGCIFLRLAGTDNQGNIYLKADFGTKKTFVNNSYIYKFNVSGAYLGKVEVPISPNMVTNRYIFVEPSGSVYYMQADLQARKLKFYQFDFNINAPSSLAANISSGAVNLSWTDNSGNETGYKIQRSTTGATEGFVELASVAGNINSYSDAGILPNTTYYYRVYASNASGGSGYSNIATARLDAGNLQAWVYNRLCSMDARGRNICNSRLVADAAVRIEGNGINRSLPRYEPGRYRADNLPVGSYTVTVSKPGFIIQARAVTIQAGQTANPGFSLIAEYRKGALSGRVHYQRCRRILFWNRCSWEPLSGVSVQVMVNGQMRSATTDRNGYYRLNDLLIGDYTVNVHKTGYSSSSRRVVIGMNQLTQADFNIR